jgi:isopentenyl diphosphate isomerase/L-lactate dehydrogenase-like FMN-dependent dehydrogenase
LKAAEGRQGWCQAWEDVRWLKKHTKLPVVLKGVLTFADAQQALTHGADAIWVRPIKSNNLT